METPYEPQTGLLNEAMVYPLKVVLSDPKRANWPSKKCTLEATGLGGSDLSFQDNKQNIYGPSMTTVEPVANCHIFGKTATTALGISKAAHEFLVLHYFATDSIIYCFFCWQLLGYVPGGAPFSQLNIGVTDAMAIIKS